LKKYNIPKNKNGEIKYLESIALIPFLIGLPGGFLKLIEVKKTGIKF
jgi:hypothetical protein